jgi:hypothetical protein
MKNLFCLEPSALKTQNKNNISATVTPENL